MEVSNSFLFERHNLVVHLGEVQLSCQLLERGAFSSYSADVAVLDQGHRVIDRSGVALLETFKRHFNYEVVEFPDFFELVTHDQAGRL